MTESLLFKRVSWALALTVAVPLIVALMSNGRLDINNRLSAYLNKISVQQAADQDSKDKTSESEDTANNTESSSDSASDSESTATAEATNSQNATGLDLASVKPASTYTVEAGDTYGCIAEKYYGSFDQWQLIYNANAGYPGFSEYGLDVGAQLVLPAVDTANIRAQTHICN